MAVFDFVTEGAEVEFQPSGRAQWMNGSQWISIGLGDPLPFKEMSRRIHFMPGPGPCIFVHVVHAIAFLTTQSDVFLLCTLGPSMYRSGIYSLVNYYYY